MREIFNNHQRNLIRGICRNYMTELTRIYKEKAYNNVIVLVTEVHVTIPSRCIEECIAEELMLFEEIKRDPDNLTALLNTPIKQSDFKHALMNYTDHIDHPEANVIWRKLFLLEKLNTN